MEGADVVKVFVAGASGAIGRVLIPQLVAAGHEVVGTTRREARVAALRETGAEAVVCDAFDADAVRAAVAAAAPEVVVDQLTSLPRDYNIRDPRFYEANDRVRREGTANVIAAARAAGVRRYIVQSISFLTRPGGPPVLDEDAPPWTDAPAPFTDSVAVLIANEQAVTGAEDFEGLALRYGQFYGPGTYFASDGSIAGEVRRRRFPVVGAGTGRSSFVHVADAAAATVCAVSRRRAWRLQHHRRRPRGAAGVAARVRRSDRRQEAVSRAEVAGPRGRRPVGGGAGVGAARGVECAGEGGVGVGAGGGVVAGWVWGVPRQRSETATLMGQVGYCMWPATRPGRRGPAGGSPS